MTTTPSEPIRVFFSYAEEDAKLRDELEKHLANLKRLNQITGWYKREITAGSEWAHEIDAHLNASQIILLLISPDFFSSDYCYGIEMRRALERHESGESKVIPVLLRPVDWEDAPFSHLSMLPTDARPITSWPNLDEAFRDVTKGIRAAVKELLTKTKEQWLDEGRSNYQAGRYERAVSAYDQAIRLDPDYARAYSNKGDALYSLKRYEEALSAYEQVIRLNSSFAGAYNNKGNALYGLKRYVDALVAYEQAIRLDAKFAQAYNNKGNTLSSLKRYEEALATYEQAIQLNLYYPALHYNKGKALYLLKRYEEALAAYEQAIRLDPNFASAHLNKGRVLEKLGRLQEAEEAYKRAKLPGYKVQKSE